MCFNGTGDTAERASNARKRLAQTFTAETTGPLVRAKLWLEFGSHGADYLLSVNAVDQDGVPTNTVLAQTTRVDDQNEIHQQITFDFAQPASVAADSRYALVLTRVLPDPNLFGVEFRWVYVADCDDQAAAYRSETRDGAFTIPTNLQGINFNFETYILV